MSTAARLILANRPFVALATLLFLVAACAGPVPTATPVPATPAEATTVSPASCAMTPVVVPTPPARPLAYLELDPVTGLHMTGTMQQLDVTAYRLVVSGKVDNPLSLSYDDLRCLPKKQVHSTLECPGFFIDEATWAGAPLSLILDIAGVQKGATSLVLASADGYAASLYLSEIKPGNDFLAAYEWAGQPIPIAHGFPVRAVLPGQTGGLWVKWLVTISVQ